MRRPNPGPRDRSNYFVLSTINMVRSLKFSYIRQMSRMRNKDLKCCKPSRGHRKHSLIERVLDNQTCLMRAFGHKNCIITIFSKQQFGF